MKQESVMKKRVHRLNDVTDFSTSAFFINIISDFLLLFIITWADFD